jgi:hypothetical protein
MHSVVMKCFLWSEINPENGAMNLDKVIDKVEKKSRPKSDGWLFRVRRGDCARHDATSLFRSRSFPSTRIGGYIKTEK